MSGGTPNPTGRRGRSKERYISEGKEDGEGLEKAGRREKRDKGQSRSTSTRGRKGRGSADAATGSTRNDKNRSRSRSNTRKPKTNTESMEIEEGAKSIDETNTGSEEPTRGIAVKIEMIETALGKAKQTTLDFERRGAAKETGVVDMTVDEVVEITSDDEWAGVNQGENKLKNAEEGEQGRRVHSTTPKRKKKMTPKVTPKRKQREMLEPSTPRLPRPPTRKDQTNKITSPPAMKNSTAGKNFEISKTAETPKMPRDNEKPGASGGEGRREAEAPTPPAHNKGARKAPETPITPKDREIDGGKGGVEGSKTRKGTASEAPTPPAHNIQGRKEKEAKEAAQSKRVKNPYKPQTPKTNKEGEKGTKEISYASAVTGSPQTKLQTHDKIKEAYDSFFDVTFQLPYMEQNPTIAVCSEVLKAKLTAVLTRAKEVDRKAKINPWHEEVDLPTITKIEDIPDNPMILKSYLSPLRKEGRLNTGRNNGWRLRITTHIKRDEFLHYWGLSKREFTKVEFITLRETPLQHSTYHAAGFFINSSDGQLIEELEEALSEDLGFKIGIRYRPGTLDKRAADELWKEAKKAREAAQGYEKSRVFFRKAPFAQQVYAPTRQQALQAAAMLSKKYGTPEEDGQYPRLPDGTRMRFVAASVYLDMQGRATAANLFPQQIMFQTMAITAPIQVRDPFQKFETQENKTMHQLLMDLQDEEMSNEPFFRHMTKKFHWNYKTKEYEVSIHGQMYERASKVLRNLKQVMTEKYGREVGDAIKDNDIQEEREQVSKGEGMSGISITTDDRYLNGPAQFIIVGMENINIDKGKTLEEIRKGGSDDNTMNLKSTTSGFTGHTGNTVPDCNRHMPNDDNTAQQPPAEDRTTDETDESGRASNCGKQDEPGKWTRQGSVEAEAALESQVTSAQSPRVERDREP